MSIYPLMLAAFVSLASTACQSPSAQSAEPMSASAQTNPSIPSGESTIRGRAMYFEKIKMAPGADFVVQLVDIQLGRTPEAIIAETRLDDVAGSPYDFVITYDPTKLKSGRQYGLFAILYDPQGGPMFTTKTPVPWTVGTKDAGELHLTMLSGGND